MAKTRIDYKAKALKRRNRFAYITGISGLLLITFSYYFYQVFFTPNVETKGKPTYVVVRRGETAKAVLDSIEATGVIVDKLSLRFVAKLMKYDKLVKPGRYELKEGYTNRQLINDLRTGSNKLPLMLTFQNIRLREDLARKLATTIDARPGQFDSLLSSPSYTKSLGFDTTSVQTMFIPNTYELAWNTSADNLMQRMKKEYEKFWTPSRDAKRKQLNLSRAEVSTLASIVEAEQQQHADERPRVAGVYLNRLRRGMKLQADPTVVYANKDFTIKRVLNVHLTKDSPYNTYKYKGLPPGPINLPSIASIDAVLNPESHDYLYFCAKEDFSGYHAFARNEQEHLVNARRYQAALTRSGIMK
ncbi:endolytic transglycosylase MltG [Microvirga sp. STR05]|uniref:Endolytic murein transglycosylase n=1 Tax=Hymenobacter duratus TaxID=2771356 RepID=A0ABR8JIT6_9BACT|nr:endolytic transglycosylase MltG [Hymenobacter duratus]MBD2715631.1 endolytic transglycosylase MltG [Hymenobacter duratus]MBR7950539.1 endolytic transglycosylase MltG [Microvirga sp. STR05]